MAHRLSGSVACGILPDQACMGTWTLPLSHQGSPTFILGTFIRILLISVGASSNGFLKGLLFDFRNVNIVSQPACSKE